MTTKILGYYTRTEAAALLGVSTQRVAIIAQRDNWTALQVGRSILHPAEDVQNTHLKMDAQKAWAILEIPTKLWGAWWLGDVDEILDVECPSCGQLAYQPAGQHPKYSCLAACPSCGWNNK